MQLQLMDDPYADEPIEMLEEYHPEEKKSWKFRCPKTLTKICFIMISIMLVIIFVSSIIAILAISYSFLKSPTSASMETIYNEEWDTKLAYAPEFATTINDNRFNAILTNFSEPVIASKHKYYLDLSKKLREVPQSDLNFRLFKYMMEMIVKRDEFGAEEYMNMDHLENGPYIELPNLIRDTNFETRKDYVDFLGRLESIATQIQERIALLKKGVTAGYTKPKITLISIPEQINSLINKPVSKSVFYEPFSRIPSSIANPQELQSRANQIIATSVYDSLKSLYNYMTNEYIPNARSTIAAKDLPKGKAYYEYLVKYFTTTSRTPDEIFDLGMSEVTRIHNQMAQIIDNIGFNGTFSDFIESMKNDTRFFAKTEEEFLMFIRDVAKRADGELVKLFKTLPRCPYGVRPIDQEQAKTAPAAYYNPPNSDCSRPGYYYVNTYDLTQRPKYVYESTTLHETVPGHHFQLAIANELQGLPKFRTIDTGEFTAFVEGWALYSESLGDTMGFYKNPYYKFGSLGDEILRACRLVVDTGMHWKGWTRDQAINFMKVNTPLSDLDITSEIDRYITWPGQALAYKSGELKIKELRDNARSVLGPKFDIRLFHDEVLKYGSLPLNILEELIKEWIEKQKKS